MHPLHPLNHPPCPPFLQLRTDRDGHRVVRELLDQMANQGEMNWVLAILEELVASGDMLTADGDAFEVLVHGLSCLAVTEDVVFHHLEVSLSDFPYLTRPWSDPLRIISLFGTWDWHRRRGR